MSKREYRRKIPSAEDFARAKAAMRADDYGLEVVCERVRGQYVGDGLYWTGIFYTRSMNLFYVHLFYRYSRMIEEAEKSGLTSRIQQAVIDGLVAAGRGDHDSINIKFEVDSHERVLDEFGGDYYRRLK